MKPNLCKACAFYREIQLAAGGKRKLCMLTGEKKPTAGMRGCRFMPGEWERIDEILGLTNGNDTGNTGLPNQTKPGNGFSRNGQTIAKIQFALDDFSVTPISHIAKAKRRFADPVPVRAGGSFDRGVCESPFCV